MSDIVYIGLGSNLGDRERQLVLAVEALGRIDAVAVLRCSSLYESAPVGPPQPRFLNGVVEVECGLSPQQLLGICKQIELDLGRTASGRWGPRAIDLDLVLWTGRVIADPNLQVPHLAMHQRRFVLEPLAELAAEVKHPVLGGTVEALLTSLGAQDVVRFPSSRWDFPSFVERRP